VILLPKETSTRVSRKRWISGIHHSTLKSAFDNTAKWVAFPWILISVSKEVVYVEASSPKAHLFEAESQASFGKNRRLVFENPLLCPVDLLPSCPCEAGVAVADVG